MAARFVLIHSPSVGPRTWQPVAHRLTELGWEAMVPSLLHVTDQGPSWKARSALARSVRNRLGCQPSRRSSAGGPYCWKPTVSASAYPPPYEEYQDDMPEVSMVVPAGCCPRPSRSGWQAS
jgi:hypothetical protein